MELDMHYMCLNNFIGIYILSKAHYELWIHLIWSTKYRTPFLNKSIRDRIFTHIRQNAYKKGIHIHEINGTDDHVHCLVSLNPKLSICKIVNEIKGESSYWINQQGFLDERFSWQTGYGVFSVSPSHVFKVKKYIKSQNGHHSNCYKLHQRSP